MNSDLISIFAKHPVSLNPWLKTLSPPVHCRAEASRDMKKMTDEKKVHQTACIMDKEGLVEHIMLLETYVEALRLVSSFRSDS